MQINHTNLGIKVRELYTNGHYEEIGSLEGFKIIEVRDIEQDKADKFGCVTWIFSGDNDKVKLFTANPLNPKGYKEVQKPKKGDIITYFLPSRLNRLFADFDPAKATHSGVYVGDGKVQSKFRESHVYEHPLDAIPPELGSEARFFRRKLLNKLLDN